MLKTVVGSFVPGSALFRTQKVNVKVVITLQNNGMVVMAKIFCGCVMPVIWFESVGEFDEFLGAAQKLSGFFKLNVLSGPVEDFIKQLDVSGI